MAGNEADEPTDTEAAPHAVRAHHRWWHHLPFVEHPPGPTGPAGVEDVDKELERAKAADRWTDVGLRKCLGYGALGILAVQLAVADVVFIIYGYNRDWDIPVSAIHYWLVAVVLQVALIAQGIGRYLFPPSGRQKTRE